ncbi:MAG TPA: hypothetical protein PJ997_02770 [Candidatus Paceibacterota bacterium]|nr:hypothetical protein [Candidatus Paceibacterota bacterium]HMP19235.1 hypothetical protein [Candidatus Paceibacterota bacterium]HMP85393.1 hypothetical protein [Candidatus Paceibacterota bacterium]
MQEKIKMVIVLLIGILVGPIVLFGILSLADVYTAEEALSYIINTVMVSGAISALMILILLFVSKKEK